MKHVRASRVAQRGGQLNYVGLGRAELPGNLLELAAQDTAGVAAGGDAVGDVAGFGAERLQIGLRRCQLP